MKENNNIELANFPPENSESIIQDNKPHNIPSSTAEIQNIFKKIRKKNKDTEIKKNQTDFRTDESKDILINTEQNKSPLSETIDFITNMTVILNIISFILFYFSFRPLLNNFYPIVFFIMPMNIIGFCFCCISAVITAGIISLIILQKIGSNHLLYMTVYYILTFFLHHYKFVGSSHFDHSMTVFYVFISILIHSICLFFSFYFILKQCYYEGKINKNNIFIKSFVSRWHSTEKIRRTQNEFLLLNDINKNLFISDKKRNKIRLFLILFLFLSIQIIHFFLMKLKKRQLFNCDNWDVGINGTKISDDYNKIKRPDGYCYMDYFNGYFDLNNKKDLDCSVRDSVKERKYFLKNIEDYNQKVNLLTTKIFAFPHTNKDQKYFLKNQKTIKNFGRLVNIDIYDLENNRYKDIEPKPEAILDFSENNIYQGKYAELKIHLNYNQTLSEERKLLENNNSLYNNIFMIYIDSTSRAHFQRTFPKLSNFVKNFMAFHENSSETNINAYQFLKYHNFYEQTQNNILPMFYGYSMKSKKGIHNIKYFKKNGFITGHEVDMCNKEQYDISHLGSEKEKDKKEYEEWDHENVAYLCDGNYFEIKDPYPEDRGPYSLKERCLYGHPTSYYMINYAKEFWEKYSKNKKYFRIAFNHGHEPTTSVISHLDEPLYNFVFEYYDKGYFDNTVLFIVSDHGNKNGEIYSLFASDFNLEKRLGTFILLLPANKNTKNYNDNLLKNQQILVTPYDIHDTMIHLIYGDNNTDDMKNIYSENNKGKSVLLSINSNERSCKKYDDWLDDSFCCMEN